MDELSKLVPIGLATIQTEIDPAQESIVVKIIPTLSKSAPILIHFDTEPSIIDLTIGESTRFEIFKDKAGCPGLEYLKSICIAVVEGNFRETVWYKSDDIVKAEGELVINNKVVKSSYKKLLSNPLAKTIKKHYDYNPYTGPRPKRTS